mgnify:CR=1 FL=1
MEPRWVSQEWRETSPCSEPSSGAADGMLCTDAKGQQGLVLQDAIMQLQEGQAKVQTPLFGHVYGFAF